MKNLDKHSKSRSILVALRSGKASAEQIAAFADMRKDHAQRSIRRFAERGLVRTNKAGEAVITAAGRAFLKTYGL